MNDKLYWIEILVGEHRGEKSTAWRDSPNGPRPWLVVAEGRFSRRAYTDDEIRAALEGAGLDVEAVFGDMTLETPKPDTERIVYVARKR